MKITVSVDVYNHLTYCEDNFKVNNYKGCNFLLANESYCLVFKKRLRIDDKQKFVKCLTCYMLAKKSNEE